MEAYKEFVVDLNHLEEAHVTRGMVESLLAQATVEEHISHGRILHRCYLLSNGFVVEGSARVSSTAKFRLETLRKAAHKQAFNELWKLQTYHIMALNATSKAIAKALPSGDFRISYTATSPSKVTPLESDDDLS